jgi:hypothetical protein
MIYIYASVQRCGVDNVLSYLMYVRRYCFETRRRTGLRGGSGGTATGVSFRY